MPTARMHARLRNLAIGRKTNHETNFLFAQDFEDEYTMPLPLKLKDERPEEPISKPSSPVSVASTLDIPGEVKSLMLPGAWVVVGKGGRPLRNDKMYDEPAAMLTAKKRKKKKTRKAAPEPEPLLVSLEEAGSSSKCLRGLERSTAQRSKQVMRSKDAKYWAGYQHAKELKRGALDELIAALSLADDQAEDYAGELPMPKQKPTKDNKANSEKAKARRRARSASAANRCSIWDDDDQSAGVPVNIERGMAKAASRRVSFEKRLSGELGLCFGHVVPSSPGGMTEPKPPGAWTTVGKRGKAVSDFPPLKQPNDKADKPGKQRTALEQSDVKRRKTADKQAKGNKCSVM